MRDLVKRLADARLVTTSVSDLDGHVDVEVAHEALIRHWPRLRRWLDEQRVDIQLRDEISEAAREWERNGRDASYLAHRGGRLNYAESLVTLPRPMVRLNHVELGYVRACLDLRKREQRRRRRLLRAAWTAAGVLLILAGVAGWQLLEAEQQRIGTIAALNASSEQLFDANKDFDALLASLTAAKQVKQALFGVDDETKARTKAALLAAHLWVKERNRLEGHELHVRDVRFSPDGKTLASTSRDGTIRLWNVADGKNTAIIAGHGAQGGVKFAPDAGTLASGGEDGTIKFWDLTTGKNTVTLSGHSAAVDPIDISPDGQTLASGSADKTVKLWDVASGRNIATLEGHKSSVSGLTFSPDGRILASVASADHTIRLWDVADAQEVAAIALDHKNLITDVKFSPDGRALASASWDGTIKVHDVTTRQIIRTLGERSDEQLGVWSPRMALHSRPATGPRAPSRSGT